MSRPVCFSCNVIKLVTESKLQDNEREIIDGRKLFWKIAIYPIGILIDIQFSHKIKNDTIDLTSVEYTDIIELDS